MSTANRRMKKILPTIFILFFVLLTLPFDVFGASLEVSKSSSFSSSDLNFSAGDTVYVRVRSGEGSTHVLNVKDSGYSTIQSVNLNRSGEVYTANFSAPSGEGYYSLEAKIEGSGSSSTSVKTIKVGSPGGADIQVNVNSSVKGTKTTTGVNKEVSNEPERSDGQDVEEDRSSDQPSPTDTRTTEVYSADGEPEQKSNWIWATIKGVFSFVWPF